MGKTREFARRYAFDALIVVGAIQAAMEIALRQDPRTAAQSSVTFAAPVVALIILTLLARRRFPFGAPTALWLLASAMSFIDVAAVLHSPAAFMAGLIAAFLLGMVRSPAQSRVGLAIAAGSIAIVVYNGADTLLGDVVFASIQVTIAWLAGWGFGLRAAQAEDAEQRAAAAERERESAARVAVAEERARIARELHDIVAHTVSVMVLQVGAVRHRLPATLQADSDALQGVEQTGRTALTEMRRLLGAMRSEGQAAELAPQPGLDSLDSLLTQVERAGLPVTVEHDGERVELPRAVDLSAYRIIQEGLTNVLKHAQARRADVTLTYSPDDVRIQIRDDGRGCTTTDGLGHGLVGVRERVKIYGGEMSTASGSNGGFVLSARLPLEAGRR